MHACVLVRRFPHAYTQKGNLKACAGGSTTYSDIFQQPRISMYDYYLAFCNIGGHGSKYRFPSSERGQLSKQRLH